VVEAPVSAAPALQADFADMQGLLRFAFKHHTEAVFLMLRISDPEAARRWISTLSVTNAVTQNPPPPTLVQVAFTYEGLSVLGIPERIRTQFSIEFMEGMAGNADRARRLGDVGQSDPQHWRWGVDERRPHIALLLYALPGRLQALLSSVQQSLTGVCETIAQLQTSDMGGVEPFGFVDGISQPQPDWERQRPAQDVLRPTYSTLSCLGEFALGYPNEYGLYTPRPLLDPREDPTGILPSAEDAADKKDLGRNGSYLVVRQLRQDVSGFWRALDRYAAGQPDLRLRLAHAMVGRTLQGEPLVGIWHEQVQGNPPASVSDLNDFTYRADPKGLGCPLGAHIRRTNPRNGDLPPGTTGVVRRLLCTLGLDAAARALDLVASTRFHRLLRRGREYGEFLGPERALQTDGAVESGLQFICLNANIQRQFEFVQSAWVMSSKFDGLGDQGDPLLGNRLPALGGADTDRFTIPQCDASAVALTGLPPFITVMGGGYFFLPGLRALRFLATVAG
jgi:deferrochelatase/peroxidase EfeB